MTGASRYQGQPVSEGRANQYLLAARSHFLASEAAEMERRGYLARSKTHPGEHCAQCLAEESKGFVSPRFLIPIGQRTCLHNCNCEFIYQKAA